MKIRMLKLAAGPEGVKRPGDEIDVEDSLARGLLEAGAAEALEPIDYEIEERPEPKRAVETRPAPKRRRTRRTKKE